MARVEFLIPGDPDTQTGGYAYDRRVALGLPRFGWYPRVHRLHHSFPDPTQGALAHARKVLGGLPTGSVTLIDGLALGVMPDLVHAQARRLRLVALVHHPLAAETGLSESRARVLHRSETSALAAARLIVVTSRHTAGLVAGMGVPRGRIVVVEPGTDATAAAHGSGQPELQLLCVGSLTPRKGHAVLFDALAALRDHPWRLICAGSDSLSPETSASLRAQLRRLALTARVSLTGEVSSAVLADLYAGSDVFVLATWFEGYGMALAEALAHGLPVVSTDAGATRATVPKGAGILVPPGDSGALSRALARVIEDPVLRCRLAAGARQAGQGLGSWQDTCAAMAGALRGVGP